jgi:AcrR family transcriptional regulator
MARAAKLFHERGYGSVSIRDIGAATGVSSSTLYHHFKDKEELLFAINERFMIEFNETIAAVDDPSETATERLREVIAAHVRFQYDRREDLLNGNHFRRVLHTEHRDRIVQLMRDYRDMVRAIADAGHRSGEFPVRDPWLHVGVILDMVNGLREWYSPGGPFTIDELAEEYGLAAVRIMGVAAAPLPPALAR